jgi:hypothetical protein
VKRVEAHYSMVRREEAGGDERSRVEVGPEGFIEGSWGRLCRLICKAGGVEGG